MNANRATSAAGTNENPDTLVVQSHRLPLPHGFLEPALDSVKRWANQQGFGYEFLDDQLFAHLDQDLLDKCAQQRVVATDIARLIVLQRYLAGGVRRVIWCDADTLIFAPDAIELPQTGAAFGREIWLQSEQGKLRARRKIHNAFMLFCAGDPVLDFYVYAAQRIVRRHAPTERTPMVPQIVGPKFLTLLHNVLEFAVLEGAQVLSPPLAQAIVTRDEPILSRYRDLSHVPAAAVNLCASELSRASVTEHQLQQVSERLLLDGCI